MTAEKQIASLEQQLNEALERLKEVTDLLRETQEQLQQAQSRLAELEKQKRPPPAFVKANKKKPKNEEKSARPTTTMPVKEATVVHPLYLCG